MEVLILLVFISLALVGCSVTFFVWMVDSGTNDHSDRLALLPLERDTVEPHPFDSRHKETR